MNFKGVEICCPACRGELEWMDGRRARLCCERCLSEYPVVCNIPDLRVSPDPYIDTEADRAKGLRVAEQSGALDFEGLIDFYYSITPVVPPQHARQYKRGLLGGLPRAKAALAAWENASTGQGGVTRGKMLEVGCGTGPMIVAASATYEQVVGVDIAFRWLVVAKARLAKAGLDVPLICACAEALPFHDSSFDCVVADSVLEHLQSPARALGQARRVMGPKARMFLATPNRFSLGPDPHTGLPAGGMLPESWVAAYVKRQGGIPPKRHLLSIFTLVRLLERCGFDRHRIFLPDIAPEQRAQFSGLMQAAIGAYHVAKRVPLSRYLLYLIGPLLYAVAERGAANGHGGRREHEASRAMESDK